MEEIIVNVAKKMGSFLTKKLSTVIKYVTLNIINHGLKIFLDEHCLYIKIYLKI